MTSQPGTYALVMACRRSGAVRIGKLGTMRLKEGFYIYVGSAFGAGGLAVRVRHHLRASDRPHWHIDYLRPACDLLEVWFTTDAARLEHRWAKAMVKLPGAGVPMPAFGSSDCGCVAHLFSYARLPSIRAFGQGVKTPVSRSGVSQQGEPLCPSAGCVRPAR